MNVPTNLKYSESHEWVDFTGEARAKIGLTDFAQYTLGSIVYVDLPGVGDEVKAGESFGDVESVKVAADLVSPVSGIVTAVNEAVGEEPERINDVPYDSWLIEVSDITSQVKLMDAAEYETHYKRKEQEG